MSNAVSHGCHVAPVAIRTVPSGGPTRETRLAVTGMGCPNCAMRVRNALASVEGVLQANVSLAPPVAHVSYELDRVDEDDLLRAVVAAGERTHHQYQACLLV